MGDLFTPGVAKPVFVIVSLAVSIMGIFIAAVRGYRWLDERIKAVEAAVANLVKDVLAEHTRAEGERFDSFDRKLDGTQDAVRDMQRDMTEVRERLARMEGRTMGK